MPLRKQGTLIKLSGAIAMSSVLMAVPATASAGLLSFLSPTTTQVTSTVSQAVPVAAPIVDTVASTVLAPVDATAPKCVEAPTVKAFAKYGDNADYSPAPNGTFESSTVGWKLSKGASITSGNDTTGVTKGSKSLRLGSGATATSPEFCVSEANPHFRFVARPSFFMSTYQALVLYRDSAGTLTQAQFLSSSDTKLFPGIWAPSPISRWPPRFRSSPAARPPPCRSWSHRSSVVRRSTPSWSIPTAEADSRHTGARSLRRPGTGRARRGRRLA